MEWDPRFAHKRCSHGADVKLACQVLLFSTMTRLLDIVEEHLEWRGLVSVRLDGATASEERGAVRLTLCVKICNHGRHMRACGCACRWDSCCACSAC